MYVNKHNRTYWQILQHFLCFDLPRICHGSSQILLHQASVSFVHQRGVYKIDITSTEMISPQLMAWWPRDKATLIRQQVILNDGYNPSACLLRQLILRSGERSLVNLVSDVREFNRHLHSRSRKDRFKFPFTLNGNWNNRWTTPTRLKPLHLDSITGRLLPHLFTFTWPRWWRITDKKFCQLTYQSVRTVPKVIQ